jgi:hypothetical protein
MCTTDINDAGGKFATGGKLPPVSTTLAANLATVVNDTAVANNGNNIRLLAETLK